MEFQLNKIDTDIRKKIQEETKEDKVHSGKNINVKKDLKEEKNQINDEELNYNEEEIEKRYIIIEGVKNKSSNITIQAEKMESIGKENSKGRILDQTK
ncbi:hypothetical protein [Clostridium beijerinckii]|uniref:hypothetical protein n=1 Tax=Clostridium beijerinckii TaxID=1520 RepID=UPI0022E882F4|nr:hypothetical protein [Clostridium beijerinckii]